MALAFRSAGTVFLANSVSTQTTFTANVPTAGGAPVTNDVLIAVGVDWAGSAITWTTPGGWTLLRNDNDGGSGNIGVHTYRKIAGASEANQNFTLSVAEAGLMVMLCYSGEDTTTPVDTSGAAMNDTLTSLVTPVVTTTVANDILLLIHTAASLPASSTPALTLPTGATSRVASTRLTGGEVVFIVSDVAQASSGTSAQYTSTLSGASSTYGVGAIAVAIKSPAAGGGTASLVTPSSDRRAGWASGWRR